jgi:Leucine-rich repeat (LRR) protein
LGMTEIADNAVKLVLDTIESWEPSDFPFIFTLLLGLGWRLILDRHYRLFLYDNNISTLPKSITMCRNLTYLNLKANNLDKFPLEVRAYIVLYNHLSNWYQLCAIVSLKTLHVSQNNIPDLPTDLVNIHNLEVYFSLKISIPTCNIDISPVFRHRIQLSPAPSALPSIYG